MELGPLLPTINGEPGVGATATLIVSQHWKPLTLHVNGEVTLTRAGNLDLFGGAILEGPRDWVVRPRPAVEAFVEREFGAASVVSGLAGAIWQLNEGLAFDLGLRAAVSIPTPLSRSAPVSPGPLPSGDPNEPSSYLIHLKEVVCTACVGPPPFRSS